MLNTQVVKQLFHCRFDPVVQASPTLIPDGFIYLRATPDICMDRMKRRSRQEEVGIEMEYLQGLHQKHEDWLRFPPPTAAASWRNQEGLSLPSALQGLQHGLRLRAVSEPRAIQGKVSNRINCMHSDLDTFGGQTDNAGVMRKAV